LLFLIKSSNDEQDYFRKTFNWRADRPAVFAAKVSKTAVIPAQLLEVIPGQPFRGALQPETVSKILDFTKVRPDVRLDRIVGNSHDLDYRNSPALRDNQIKLELLPWQIPASQLAPPELQFGSGPVSCNSRKSVSL
jgi:eukaryotic translation initiation factor 2C